MVGENTGINVRARNIIKIVLSILFFICLLDMPYGYYQFVRFSGFLGFGVLMLDYYNRKGLVMEVFIFLSLALLFQPFLKVALGRILWNIVDVIVGLGLVVSVIKSKK